MRKVTEWVSQVAIRILFAGAGVQIILGVIWMCLNITKLSFFVSEGGWLWSFLEPGLRRYYFLTYLGQLALASIADLLWIRQLFGKKMRSCGAILPGFCVLTLLTLPQLLQCHLSIAPYSLVCSFTLMWIYSLFKWSEEKENPAKYMLFSFALLLLLIGLLPEYFLPGGCLELLFALVLFVKKRGSQERSRSLIAIFSVLSAVLILVEGVNGFDGVPRKEEVAFSALSRVAWKNFAVNLEVYGDIELENTTSGILLKCMDEADKMKTELPKWWINQYGMQKSIFYCYDIARNTLEKNWKEPVKSLLLDVRDYLCIQKALETYLWQSENASYSGRNYEFMIYYTPKLTAFYVRYEIWWFSIIVVIMLLLGAIGFIEKNITLGQVFDYKVLLVFGFSIVISVMYTLRGSGMMDYKLSLVTEVFWHSIMFWLVCNTLCMERKELK